MYTADEKGLSSSSTELLGGETGWTSIEKNAIEPPDSGRPTSVISFRTLYAITGSVTRCCRMGSPAYWAEEKQTTFPVLETRTIARVNLPIGLKYRLASPKETTTVRIEREWTETTDRGPGTHGGRADYPGR